MTQAMILADYFCGVIKMPNRDSAGCCRVLSVSSLVKLIHEYGLCFTFALG